jgi:hypothetical protein
MFSIEAHQNIDFLGLPKDWGVLKDYKLEERRQILLHLDQYQV